MKTSKLFRVLIALLLLAPLSVMTSCSEEDAPEFSHSVNDLVGGSAGSTWTWNTTAGDLAEAFEITIQNVSDTQFIIDNFAGVGGDKMTVTISGSSLTFSGDVTGGSVKDGTGTITNGWATMDISFTIDNGDELISCSATLEHEKMISKKAILHYN